MDEDMELLALQEALTEARTEIERLQVIAADREARAVELQAALTAAQQAIEQQGVEIEGLRAQVESLRTERVALQEAVAAAQEQAQVAVAKYREAVLTTSPELPADLVKGDTVTEIEASLAQARQVVTRVREHLEAQQGQRTAYIPVGAPSRLGPDLSGLSPQEKIALGLRHRS